LVENLPNRFVEIDEGAVAYKKYVKGDYSISSNKKEGQNANAISPFVKIFPCFLISGIFLFFGLPECSIQGLLMTVGVVIDLRGYLPFLCKLVRQLCNQTTESDLIQTITSGPENGSLRHECRRDPALSPPPPMVPATAGRAAA
jgi:hypothetical protein